MAKTKASINFYIFFQKANKKTEKIKEEKKGKMRFQLTREKRFWISIKNIEREKKVNIFWRKYVEIENKVFAPVLSLFFLCQEK